GELVVGSSEMNEALQMLDSELQKIDDIDLDVLEELQLGVANIAEAFDEAGEGMQDLRENYSNAYEELKAAIDSIAEDDISEEDIETLYERDTDQEIIKKLVATYEAAQEMKEYFANVKEAFNFADETLCE